MIKSVVSLFTIATVVAHVSEAKEQVFGLGNKEYDILTTVQPRVTFGPFEGWGTSLAWWSNSFFGTRQDIADAFFSLKNETVDINGTPLPTLGMNIVRYNIGGSARPGQAKITVEGEQFEMKVSSRMPNYKALETFWIDWRSSDTKSSSWDWSRDISQRTMLQLAKDRGVNIFEAFSNSPPWWMTYNNATAGGSLVGFDNLRKDQHKNFAYYLASVVKKAKEEWGIEFQWVQPVNEPSGPWWVFPWSQEGCRFSIPSQISIIKLLRQQLDSMGLTKVGIAGLDENNPDVTLFNLGMLALRGKDALNLVGKINTHGYYGIFPYRGPTRGPLYQAVHKLGKKLWNSEHGEGEATGISMAETLSYDFNEMHVNGWVYWQAIDGGAWGLLDCDIENGNVRRPNGKYYVMAQYSRHIRPGMTIMANKHKYTITAYDRSRRMLVIVSVNNVNKVRAINYDLSNFSQVKGPIYGWSTQTDGTGDLYKSFKATDTVQNKQFTAKFGPKHVKTFEIHGVVL